MTVTGIICEYNPFHAGHSKQLALVRSLQGQENGIVCLMSGNFVQRGHPAIVDKSLRAQAAVRAGADLVLEMPVTVSLSSAEGFAAGSVKILSRFCQSLCFGAETAQAQELMATARALLGDRFPPALRAHLDAGLSFPAARARALEDLGLNSRILQRPNDTLAVEYCKAILSQESPLDILPIHRGGDYHSQQEDPDDPSATFLRREMLTGADCTPYMPATAQGQLSGPLHALHWGEKAILARLRAMTAEEFEDLPYSSEGLWRKLMDASRRESSLEEILTAVKSKRYTRTRLDRMVMCAFLGLREADMVVEAPYIRVLAANSRGRELLKQARKTMTILNPGQVPEDPYWERERRIGDLYGLFAPQLQPPGAEHKRRIICEEQEGPA